MDDSRRSVVGDVIWVLEDVLRIVWNFFTDPIGQLLCWGILTIWIFAYTLIQSFKTNCTNSDTNCRVITSAMMIGYWCVNATLWFTHLTKWMLLTDSLFSLLALGIFLKITNSRWMLWLVILFGITLLIDLGYFAWLSQQMYSILVNVLYAIQLYLVSGYKSKYLKKLRHTSHQIIFC